MKKKVSFILICLLTSAILVACGPSQPAFGMNEPVEGDEWRITVRFAENKGAEFEMGGQTFETDDPNTYLLFVQIELENLNESPVEAAYLHGRIVVRDNVGDTYPWSLAGPAPVFYVDSTKEGTQQVLSISDPKAPIQYIFAVPNDVTTLDLLWIDLPPVRLVVK
jgi:hypothetical protein